MSIFDTAAAICPVCGTEAEVEIVVSVNADRRPELRQQILDGTFQAVPCSHCGAKVRLPPEFVYFELKRARWIATYPAVAVAQWQQTETQAGAIFQTAFGSGASPAIRELAQDLTPRVVFGWPALQEKLLCDDLGLQDSTLELLKAATLAGATGLMLTEDAELRLSGGNTETLAFDWLRAPSEAVMQRLTVPRQTYEDIAADPQPWAALRAQFEGQLFVDMKRALVEASDQHTDSGET
jgi:CpXC protein